jgi:hypothetical protein
MVNKVTNNMEDQSEAIAVLARYLAEQAAEFLAEQASIQAAEEAVEMKKMFSEPCFT